MPRTYKPKLGDLPARYEPGFLSRLDGRSELARGLRDRYLDIIEDLGGEDNLSIIKASMIERFLFLEATLQRIEFQLATAEDEKSSKGLLGAWIQGNNSLIGMARTLGIDRADPKTIRLEDYTKEKAAQS